MLPRHSRHRLTASTPFSIVEPDVQDSRNTVADRLRAELKFPGGKENPLDNRALEMVGWMFIHPHKRSHGRTLKYMLDPISSRIFLL